MLINFNLVNFQTTGPTMLLSRSHMNNTISLYLFWKSIEMLYIWALKKGWVGYKDQTIAVLYALSTAQLAYVTILEPRAMRPSYLKFIDRITGQKLSNFNRAGIIHPFPFSSRNWFWNSMNNSFYSSMKCWIRSERKRPKDTNTLCFLSSA